jgi:hypothetical protein
MPPFELSKLDVLTCSDDRAWRVLVLNLQHTQMVDQQHMGVDTFSGQLLSRSNLTHRSC